MDHRYDQGRVLILRRGYHVRQVTKTRTWKRNQHRDLIIYRAYPSYQASSPNGVGSQVIRTGAQLRKLVRDE